MVCPSPASPSQWLGAQGRHAVFPNPTVPTRLWLFSLCCVHIERGRGWLYAYEYVSIRPSATRAPHLPWPPRGDQNTELFVCGTWALTRLFALYLDHGRRARSVRGTARHAPLPTTSTNHALYNTAYTNRPGMTGDSCGVEDARRSASPRTHRILYTCCRTTS